MAKNCTRCLRPLPVKAGASSSRKLEDLIDEYNGMGKYTNPGMCNYKCWLIGSLDSFDNITEFICGAKNPGGKKINGKYKRGSHQRHLLTSAIDDFKKALKTNEPQSILLDVEEGPFTDFEDLYDTVRKEVINTDGIGIVTNYDFCLRYIWNRDKSKEPNKYVYIHNDLKEAANLLIEMGRFYDPKKVSVAKFSQKLKGKDYRVEFDLLQDWLKKYNMTSKDIENFLCHFLEEIKAIYCKWKTKVKIPNK